MGDSSTGAQHIQDEPRAPCSGRIFFLIAQEKKKMMRIVEKTEVPKG